MVRGWGELRIRLEDIWNYGLRGLSLEIPGRGLTVVLGPNGAGKTTLLKVIAGLAPYRGRVYYDDVEVTGLPPYERRVSYVPQGNALFYNMTVYENIAFGLRARGLRGVEERVRETAALLGLSGLLGKYPSQLSGGEARKVALARALAVEPELVLLDEPFTNLDPAYQGVLEQEIMMIVRRLGRKVIMVTHSVERALGIAEQLVILVAGRAVYSGGLSGLADRSLDVCVSSFLGSLLDADEIECRAGFCQALLGGYVIPLTLPGTGLVDGSRIILVPRGSVRVSRRGGIKGIVEAVEESGGHYLLKVSVEGRTILVESPFNPGVGSSVGLKIKSAYLLPRRDRVSHRDVFVGKR